MLLLSDIDGVALNWHAGYCDYFHFDQSVPDEYNASAKFTLPLIEEFNRSDMFGKLKPMARSNEVFPMLLALDPILDIHFVTSAIPSGLNTVTRLPIVQRRIQNIEKDVFMTGYSPDHIRYSMLELRKDKTPFYLDLAVGKHDVFVVEDHFDTAISVANAVPHANILVMRQAYNDTAEHRDIIANTPNIQYVDDWYGVYDILKIIGELPSGDNSVMSAKDKAERILHSV